MAGSKGFGDAHVHTGDRQLDSIQQARQDVTKVANQCPFLRGKLIEGVVFAAGVARIVTHRLGYPAKGYLVLRNYGTVTTGVPGETGTAAPDPNNQVWMVATWNSTFDIWFCG